MIDDNDERYNKSSFAIAIEPEFVDGVWSGEVTTYVEEHLTGDLSEQEADQIRSVCGMVASCLPLMEKDEDFREYVKQYFEDSFKELIEDLTQPEDESPVFTRKADGNVVHLTFNTKTHGSA